MWWRIFHLLWKAFENDGHKMKKQPTEVFSKTFHKIKEEKEGWW